MPRSQDSIQKELYDQLRTFNFDVTPMDSSGKEVPVPEDAEILQFQFESGDTDYGTVTVSIDGLRTLTVYFGDSVADSNQHPGSGEITWTQFLKFLKRFATTKQMGFRPRDVDNLKNDMKQREHVKKKEISEGYYGTKTQSYNDAVPTVKLIIKHNKKLDETDARFRNIDKIFIENSVGERFLLPTTSTKIAKAYARHIAEGGSMYDDRAKHIQTLAEEYGNLRGFMRATKNLTNESTQPVIEQARLQFQSIKETLNRLSGRRGYSNYFENWSPTLTEETPDYSQLSEMFTENNLDPRIESAFPILAKMGVGKQSAVISELADFENWASALTFIGEESPAEVSNRGDARELAKLLKNPLPVGPDGQNANPAISDIIDDEELYSEIAHLAKHDPDADARGPIIDWLNKNVDNPKYAAFVKDVDADEYEDVEPEEEEETEVAVVDTEGPEDKASVPPLPEKEEGGEEEEEAGGETDPLAAAMNGLTESELSRIMKLSGL